MTRRAGFVLLLLTLGVFASQRALAQESPATEGNAKLSKTHCDFSSCVEKILYFSNISQPNDLQDVVNAIRVIAEIQRAQQIMSGAMIIVAGTAEQVAAAEKLATAIDSGKRRFGGLGYRIDLKIEESKGDRKLHSRLYSFVTEAHQGTTMSIRRRSAAPVTKEASETKPPEYTTSRSIDCRILVEDEHTLELSVDVEFASSPATNPVSTNPPLLRLKENVTVELDQPTVVGTIDDPDSERTFTLEVTATRIANQVKDKS